jgi:hypothetical protein
MTRFTQETVTIEVRNVWFSAASEFGQTILWHQGRVKKAVLKQVAITSATAEILARIPIDIYEPVIVLRLRQKRGNNVCFTFIEWSLGYHRNRVSAWLRQAAQYGILRVYALLTDKKYRS